MNGQPASGGWKVAHTPEGRPYYYANNQTTWSKPDELLTPAQRATGWEETSDAQGRPYWVNKVDRSTSWEPPAGWNDSLPPRPNEFVSSNFAYPPQRDHAPRESRQRDRDDYHRPNYNDQGGYRGPIAVTPKGIEYATPAEAEAAYQKLLKKAGVEPDWTWEQALRVIVGDPSFRALEEPTARKEAFLKYQDDLKAQEKEREKERAQKFRIDFRNTLLRHGEIKHFTRWKTAREAIEDEPVFRSSSDEDEKKRLFRDYVVELRQQHEEKRYTDHEAAMKELSTLMRDINVTPESHWEEAHERLQAHPAFVKDEKYQTLAKFEILDAFQAQVQRLWEDVNTIRQREKQLQYRQTRKAREAFIDLLQELQAEDKMKPDTTWDEIYTHVEGKPQYEALLDKVKIGKGDGSTPEDLYYDTLDDLEREIADVRVELDRVLKSIRFRVGPKTTLEEFTAATQDEKALIRIRPSHLEAAFRRLQQHAADHEEELARDEKRQQRKAIDALRSRIKRLDPPVHLEDTYDQLRPRIEHFDEYLALATDEDRRAAFDKHISRLQEDADRDRARRHRHDERERDRHRRSDRGSRRSRSPLPPPRRDSRDIDAYEADRRRAADQRERQHRHASSAGGLSPPPLPPPGRTRSLRDMDLDRPVPSGRSDRYDRERRERDAERERAYVSRADPFAKAADLDYGDSSDAGPAQNGHGNGVEKRKSGAGSSDAGRERGSKRVKTEEPEQVDEPVALQSGSEEGEIEEV